MKYLDKLEVQTGRWDDPGDYPSAMGAGPLPSRIISEGMDGAFIIVLDAGESPPAWDELEEIAREQSAHGHLVEEWEAEAETLPDGRARIILSPLRWDDDECDEIARQAERDAWEDAQEREYDLWADK